MRTIDPDNRDGSAEHPIELGYASRARGSGWIHGAVYVAGFLGIAGGIWLFLELTRSRAYGGAPSRCRANLRGIAQGMHIYAENGGAFPPDFTALVDGMNCVPNQFLCPESGASMGDLAACYVYIPGQGPDSDVRNVLVYEKRGHHRNDAASVLFVDGHAESIGPYERVLKLVSETRARLAAASQPVGGGR